MAVEDLVFLGVTLLMVVVIGAVLFMARRDSLRQAEDMRELGRELDLTTWNHAGGEFRQAGRLYRFRAQNALFQISLLQPCPDVIQFRGHGVSLRTDMDMNVEDDIDSGDVGLTELGILSAADPALARRFVARPEVVSSVRELLALGFTDMAFNADGVHATRFAGLGEKNLNDEQMRERFQVVPNLLARLARALPAPVVPVQSQRVGRRRSLHSMVAYAVLLMGVALFAAGAWYFPPMTFEPIALFSLLPGLLLAFALIVWGALETKGSLGGGYRRLLLVIVALPAGLVFSLGSVVVANGVLDTAPSRFHVLPITAKTDYPGGVVHRGSRPAIIDPAWTVTVPHWSEQGASFELRIDEAAFKGVRPAQDELTLELGPGYFGFEWNRSVVLGRQTAERDSQENRFSPEASGVTMGRHSS